MALRAARCAGSPMFPSNLQAGLSQAVEEMRAVCAVCIGGDRVPVALGIAQFGSFQLRAHHPRLLGPPELAQAGEQGAQNERQPATARER